jgi:uncharacterized membrane protein YgdD (TMEM256/DUF423 family)
MKRTQAFCLRAAAVQGFLAVSGGAFGAHGLKFLLAGLPAGQIAERQSWAATGAHYQLVHAAALLALAALAPRLVESRLAHVGRAFFYGPLLFAASLYALALGAPPWVGALTPLGGLGMLLGWALLFFSWDFRQGPAAGPSSPKGA